MKLSCFLIIVNSPSLDDFFKINGVQILCLFFEPSFFFISSLSMRNGDAIIEEENSPFNARYALTFHNKFMRKLSLYQITELSQKRLSISRYSKNEQSKTRPPSMKLCF